MQLPTVPELAAMIDHAVLKPTQTERDVVDACAIARKEHIASVCVKPFYVPITARLLKDSGVDTSTVIGFPRGGQSPEVKATTALNALRDGATELDMVINIGALIDKDYATIEREVGPVLGGQRNEAHELGDVPPRLTTAALRVQHWPVHRLVTGPFFVRVEGIVPRSARSDDQPAHPRPVLPPTLPACRMTQRSLSSSKTDTIQLVHTRTSGTRGGLDRNGSSPFFIARLEGI